MEKLRYIAYCRRSSEDNREKQALSIPAQIDEVKKRFSDLKIVDWVEESHSAFDIGRPKFNKMIEDIRAGKADGIISWHPDRLARNAPDGSTIIYLLDKNILKDLKFSSYTYNNDAEGKMMLNIMFGQSKYFSDKLSKDVKRGQAKKVRNGQWPGLAPVGYINTYCKPKGENEILSDPDRFNLVRKMWDLMLTGNYSVEKITTIANNEWNFRTIKRRSIGGRPIGKTTVYDMFTNPFYYGTMRRKGEYTSGTHKPMITPGEYDRVQQILGKEGKPRPKTHEFAFTGLMKCGECGGSITAEDKQKVLKDGSVRNYTYYHCSKQKKGIKCYQRSVDASKIENFVLDELGKIEIDDDFLAYAKKYLVELNDKEIEERGDIYHQTERAYKESQNHLDRLTKAYYRDLIDEDEFKRQREELLLEKSRMKSQLDQVEDRANNWLKLSLEAFDFARYAKYWFQNGDLNKKKLIAQKMGSNFLLKDGIITLELNNIWEIICKGNIRIKKEVATFELNKSNSYTNKLALSDALTSVWRGRPDSNRRSSP